MLLRGALLMLKLSCLLVLNHFVCITYLVETMVAGQDEGSFGEEFGTVAV